MTIPNDYNIGDIIYVKHDIEQLPRMIIEIRIRKYDVVYECQSGTEFSTHQDFEMSKTKIVF